ncbi:MAG: pyridoxamine 5'-phosphate oxidase [Mesonia hippocampi]|uniref:pyridoxamine 5'-phosphate oxidase n=1 Tax=Mesonia hippocampi TaxID=1628250 RepID=UPI003F966D09
MEKNLENYRKNYQRASLEEDKLAKNPIETFQDWFQNAEKCDAIEEVNAMTLSTIGLDGFPKNRVVLLKRITNLGFVFYTNYQSEKGKAIANNKHVCLSFFWPALEQQIIIKGVAEKISEAESDAYFNSRPIGSRLGAMASNQSQPIASRNVLEEKLITLQETFKDEPIVRPKHWGGYLVKLKTVEFWQGRPNRLHDRILYTKNEKGAWDITRLAP